MPAQAPKPATSRIDRRRRRYPRHRGDFQVSVTFFEDDQPKNVQGQCRDLSQAGIGILLAAELKAAEVASLSFNLPGSTAVWDVRGVVRYRHGYHYGFEFLSLQREQQEFLTSYLKTLPIVDD
jgi:c-di-GMP-binding flagellar brake protein YcgR